MPVWLRRIAIAAVLIAAMSLAVFQLAVHLLRGQIESALGPRGQVARIEIGLDAVVLHDLRISAERGGAHAWPAADELRARRVEVVPQLRALLSSHVRIARITVEGAYLSMLRTRDGGLRVLPAMLERPDRQEGADMPALHVERIELRDGVLEFFDASVRRTPHRLALEGANVDIGPLDLPALDGQTDLSADAVVKGPRQGGRVKVVGTFVPASREANLQATLRGVDLVAFQPYLIRAAETGVKRGTMDLDIRPVVSGMRLKAPGRLVLGDLELASGNTFMGMPRSAVLALMKDRNGRISVDFVLEGQIDDPEFSLDESIATRVASSVAESLGVSLGGLVRGVGRAGSSAAKGVSEAVGKLFGD